MKSILQKLTCVFALAVFIFSAFFAIPVTTASADDLDTKRYYEEVVPVATASSETITFASKTQTLFEFDYTPPMYYTASLSNACGPVAGAIIVGFYDKFYEDLIPNFTAYYPATGKYKTVDSTYVPALIQNLYTLMRTNVDDVGVSEGDCLSGLKSYVQGKGRSVTYTDIFSTELDIISYANSINSNIPVLLFCNSVELYGIAVDTNSISIDYLQSSGSHVMVGCGYRQFLFYDANGNHFRTETFLKVRTGWSGNALGYIKINTMSAIEDAYIVNVS